MSYPDESQFRPWKVEKACKFLASGFYDDPWILEQIWDEAIWRSIGKDAPISPLINRILKCPEGDGAQFRDLTADALSRTLHDIVDTPLVRTEFPCCGGRGDIELPLRTENLGENPLWQTWSRRYEIRSIITETKNTKRLASIRDVQQILGYVVTARLGGFGFLVSRRGFSRNAILNLRAIAEGERYLILPFDQAELCKLLTVSALDEKAASVYLRRKETLLRQAA